ncbi:MAG: class II fructose-bisphosphate aldolase [Clostridiales bacterium]|nr:class II fructose-bisphosphate aldolase [Clostridiales bacterium]
MALEKVSEILKMADRAKTSAIAFNCVDYPMIKSVVKVAEELNKPTIIMLYPEHARDKHWTTPAVFAAAVKTEAKKVKVPIGLHLDHCSDYNYILAAIKEGFQSVMYDGSMLSVEENIKNTREVAKAAHALGADVEAELGRVGFANTVTDQSDEDMYTKAEVAASFCEQSNCNSVAVAVGTAHGFYKETPKLDIQRLKSINAATDVPLVMHGGSGVPDEQLEIAFREGINKFNVGTEFFYLYYQTMQEFCSAGHPDFFDLPLLAQERLENYLRTKMLLSKL